MNVPRLKHNCWVLVADGEKALFLKNEGTAVEPDLSVVHEVLEPNPPTNAQGSDRPGRFNDGPSPHKSAMEETDWHRVAKERFAGEIATRLYDHAHRGDFDELVVIAPPLVLGELRKQYHKEVGVRVVAEVSKTLTNWPIPKIVKALAA